MKHPAISTFDSVDLNELAATFKTPLYVYSQTKIEEQVSELQRALSEVKHLTCYAVKANSNLSILRLFNKLGTGFDVVSAGELRRIEKIEGDFSKVVISGVGKTREEIALALEKGVKVINVESLAELGVVLEVAHTAAKVAPIGFRLNPDVLLDTHPHNVTGSKESKFGMPKTDITAAWDMVRSCDVASLVGVSTHVGSGGSEIEPFAQSYAALLEAAREFSALGASIKYIDVGGGFAVSYSGAYQPLNLIKLKALMESLTQGTEYVLILEPGKFLVAEAGILLTRVLYRKANGAQKFIVVDAGMNDLIRPSLYEAYHKIDVVAQPAEKRVARREIVDVVGPVCESGCFFARAREIPQVREGDVLAIRDTGAYGFSMASHYNSRPLAAEVLVHHGNVTLIRKRDGIEELWHNELL